MRTSRDRLAITAYALLATALGWAALIGCSNAGVTHHNATYIAEDDAEGGSILGGTFGWAAAGFDLNGRLGTEPAPSESSRVVLDLGESEPAILAGIHGDHMFDFVKMTLLGRHKAALISSDAPTFRWTISERVSLTETRPRTINLDPALALHISEVPIPTEAWNPNRETHTTDLVWIGDDWFAQMNQPTESWGFDQVSRGDPAGALGLLTQLTPGQWGVISVTFAAVLSLVGLLMLYLYRYTDKKSSCQP